MSSLANPNENNLFGLENTSSNAYLNYYNPANTEQNAINPNNSANTSIAPSTGYFNFNLQSTQNTNPQGQSLLANGQTGIVPPQLPQEGVQTSPTGSQSTSNPNSGAFNSNALSLFSQTAQQSGVGKSVIGNLGETITNQINSFGSELGFASSTADTAANLAAFGVAPGASTEAAAAAADSTASFAAGTSDLGASTFGATLSGTLGAAGLGFIGGGIIAHALGENSTGGSIGGAVGAAAGYALGGAGAAALGLELGAFAGPVGAIVGGIGGAIFGGLFGGGGSAPTSASGESGYLTSSGSLNGITTGGKNSSSQSNSTVSRATQNFSSLAESANTALGIQFSPTVQFAAGYSSKHGGAQIRVTDSSNSADSGYIYYDPSNAASVQQANLQALQAAASYSGYSNTQQLNDWFNQTYVNSNNGASNLPPTLPNNPNQSAGTNSFQQFLTNYKAQQNANAAPSQTTVGSSTSSTSST